MLDPGSLVLVHLHSPTEKFWGVLEELNTAGVTLRALNVSSFEDFVAQSATVGRGTVSLSTMFVPLLRVERIFLDEPSGELESYAQRFERRVGQSLEGFLAEGPPGDGH